MKAIESTGRAYLVLWKWTEAERIRGEVITRGEGRHSGGLNKGDLIFVWATKGDELYILGAIKIERAGRDWAEGKSLYGPFQIIPLRRLKWRLRFVNSISPKLSRETDIALQVRARRQPAPPTIELLKKLLSEGAVSRASKPNGTNERRSEIHSHGKRMDKKRFTIQVVGSALAAIRHEISEPQMSMLRAHYIYRVLSMERIAKFGGYDSYRAANSQYGALCGRIAREIGFDSPGDQTYTVATIAPTRDKRGATQWQMDDVFVKALDRAGWFSEVVKELAHSGRKREIKQTERASLIQARRGQGRFRMDVIALWGSCAVTGCSIPGVLSASHILPWAQCKTNTQRLDALNGLLLTPNLHKLFDELLISFKDSGTILISKVLSIAARNSLGVTQQSRLRFVRPAMLPYLKQHRSLFMKKEQALHARAR